MSDNTNPGKALAMTEFNPLKHRLGDEVTVTIKATGQTWTGTVSTVSSIAGYPELTISALPDE